MRPPSRALVFVALFLLSAIAATPEAADAALAAQPTLFRRFYTAGTIPHDDPDAIAFLQAIGADPVSVLEPE